MEPAPELPGWTARSCESCISIAVFIGVLRAQFTAGFCSGVLRLVWLWLGSEMGERRSLVEAPRGEAARNFGREGFGGGDGDGRAEALPYPRYGLGGGVGVRCAGRRLFERCTSHPSSQTTRGRMGTRAAGLARDSGAGPLSLDGGWVSDWDGRVGFE